MTAHCVLFGQKLRHIHLQFKFDHCYNNFNIMFDFDISVLTIFYEILVSDLKLLFQVYC